MASPAVAIIAAGEMGSAVGARLAEHGVKVTTSLAGRSGASAARAERARMVPVADDDTLVGEADYVLSICPPGEAVALARRIVVFSQRPARIVDDIVVAARLQPRRHAAADEPSLNERLWSLLAPESDLGAVA